jgi:choline-sulfatase
MTPKPANLVVIMSDEHDPRYMGASGHPFIQTPNLDRLAARGLRFANAYTPCPICVPARAAFATGTYVHQNEYWDNAIAYDGRIPSWGHALQQAGIRVDSVGKLHYQDDESSTGFDRQHQPMHIYKGHGMVFGSIRDPLPEPFEHRMIGSEVGPGDSSYNKYDRSTAEIAARWIEEQAGSDRPWVLYVGFVAPHFPFVAPQEFFDLYPIADQPPRKLHPRDGYRRHPWLEEQHRMWPHDEMFRSDDERKLAVAAYYALCSYVDAQVGVVLDAIERSGLNGTTRVIYTSDHGDNVGARGLWGKSNLYQESVAVPMLMAGPGIAPGVVETPVSLVDLYPTILDAVGAPDTDASTRRPGRSLFDIAAEPADPERIAFSEYHAFGAASGAFMLRKGRWKYHCYPGFPPELFDLEADPEETTDLAGRPESASTLAMMRAEMLKICDPDAVDRQAKAVQATVVERFGGRDAARRVGAPGATPAPIAAEAGAR